MKWKIEKIIEDIMDYDKYSRTATNILQNIKLGRGQIVQIILTAVDYVTRNREIFRGSSYMERVVIDEYNSDYYSYIQQKIDRLLISKLHYNTIKIKEVNNGK